MTNFLNNKIHCFLVLFGFFSWVYGDLQQYLNLQHRRPHLPEVKFQNDDYQDQEMEETQQMRDNNWSGEVLRKEESLGLVPPLTNIHSNSSSNFDPNIKLQKNWTSVSDLGQLSAVDLDKVGNIAIFSRGSRVWGQRTFTYDDRFDRHKGPIPENVITLISKDGKRLLEWGKNTFYLPHGLTIDENGDYWTTDVAMHMVMKFEASEIEKNREKLAKERSAPSPIKVFSSNDDLFANAIVKPSMTLGVPFEPGNDNERFCKPTAVAIMKNGDFFVSDGYCNSRIIKFNKKGERITQFGRASQPGFAQKQSPYAFFVPHALALAEEQGFLYVADRENGRILCFHVDNGSFHKEYKNPTVGTKVYSIAHAGNRIYAVNGKDLERNYHVMGFGIDAESGKVVSEFGPEGFMKGPHDIAVKDDGSEIYVVELDDHVVYKFLQVGDLQSKNLPQSNATVKNLIRKESVPLTSTNNDDGPKKVGKMTIIFTIMISSMIFIGLCVAVAAVVARCQKRGCLLSVRKKPYWDNDKNDNFKLSSLLESRTSKKGFRLFDKRPNKKDFSKLNTEPETSDEERGEDSLII